MGKLGGEDVMVHPQALLGELRGAADSEPTAAETRPAGMASRGVMLGRTEQGAPDSGRPEVE